MIERPAVHVRISAADAFRTSGPESHRVQETARHWSQSTRGGGLPSCEIQVISALRLHAGLGLGTQLGLAVAAGLTAFLGLPQPSIPELARSVARGTRSAVGTHGFAKGGLLFEIGKLPSETLSPLKRRVSFPAEWRFVLVCPIQGRGLHGRSERRVFSNLPPVSQEVADRLSREICERMLPAAESGDFENFSKSVYEYGHQAGLCFSEFQGGAYNGPEAERLVRRMRGLGVTGVGQSSWGPTVFGLCPCQRAADRLVSELRNEHASSTADIWVSGPRNSGADIRVLPGET
ncbi:MAG: hypothetical protein ACC645_19545 [Pirellulales bacterium]